MYDSGKKQISSIIWGVGGLLKAVSITHTHTKSTLRLEKAIESRDTVYPVFPHHGLFPAQKFCLGGISEYLTLSRISECLAAWNNSAKGLTKLSCQISRSLGCCFSTCTDQLQGTVDYIQYFGSCWTHCTHTKQTILMYQYLEISEYKHDGHM